MTGRGPVAVVEVPYHEVRDGSGSRVYPSRDSFRKTWFDLGFVLLASLSSGYDVTVSRVVTDGLGSRDPCFVLVWVSRGTGSTESPRRAWLSSRHVQFDPPFQPSRRAWPRDPLSSSSRV